MQINRKYEIMESRTRKMSESQKHLSCPMFEKLEIKNP